MYVFVLIALATSTLWVALERPRDSPSRALIRFGILSYAAFAVISGAFWVFSPASTAQLVPGHSGGTLVATATQARGVIVIVLGLLCMANRKLPPTATAGVLVGPFFYNFIMSGEALAAQFTVLATPERWLYVGCHFLWAVCFSAAIREQLRASDTAAGPGWSATRISLVTFAALALGGGLFLFAIPYGFQIPSQSPVASSFLAHSLHGLAGACVALSALAIAVAVAPRRESLIFLVVAVAGLAALSLIRASELESLEPAARLIALICIVHTAVWCIRGSNE